MNNFRTHFGKFAVDGNVKTRFAAGKTSQSEPKLYLMIDLMEPLYIYKIRIYGVVDIVGEQYLHRSGNLKVFKK